MPNIAKYRLFSYPLPDVHNTAYQKLGVAPTATLDEIRNAKSSTVNRIKGELAEISGKLEDVYKRVPEIRQTEKDVEDLRAATNQGGDISNRLREKERALAKLEERAISINPEYKELQKKEKDLEKQINEINMLNLENSAEREVYDESAPPCALLKLESDQQEVFTDRGRKTTLYLLRAEVSQFLEGNGGKCYHPSDLTRSDFLSDFSHNSLLDE